MAFVDQELVRLAREQDFITTDGYLEFAIHAEGFHYQKRDFLFFSGRWRGEKITRFVGRKYYSSETLIVGHSDYYLHPWQAKMLKIRGTRKIFSTNATPVKDLVMPIPQGLTNNCDDSPLHRVLGNSNLILDALLSQKHRDPFTGSCYVNFSIDTNESIRSNVVQVARSLPNTVFQRYDMTNEGRTSYLQDLRKYNFVLCPQGNGMDTHRVWETLYMGGYPVVIRTPYMEKILEILPVVWVSDWKEINENGFLENSWNSLETQIHDTERLRLSWWTSFMQSEARRTESSNLGH